MSTPPPLQWLCIPYSELNTQQLYQVLRLRAEVFVVEQDCPYQDLDGLDQQAFHLLGQTDSSKSDSDLLAYARLLPPGVKYPEPSIGRVVTSPAVRGQNIGSVLLQEAITRCESTWPGTNIRISAQQHLEAYYQKAGFTTVSAPYMEDNIPHIEMLRHPHSSARPRAKQGNDDDAQGCCDEAGDDFVEIEDAAAYIAPEDDSCRPRRHAEHRRQRGHPPPK